MKYISILLMGLLFSIGAIAEDDQAQTAKLGSALELRLPLGFEAGSAKVDGQYVFVKRGAGGPTLLQVIFIPREEPHKADGEARELRLQSMLYLLSLQHQDFSAYEPEKVPSSASEWLVSQWTGNKGGRPFTGYLGTAIVGNDVAVLTLMNSKQEERELASIYKAIFSSFRKAGG